MIRLRLGIGLLLALLLISLITAKPASAADGFNVTSSPLPLILNAKPGSSVSTDLRIKNTGTEQIKIKVGLLKFTAAGERGQPNFQERGAEDDYFDWVRFNPSVFDAQPGVWNSIKMTIDVPSTAALGYYYAVTFSPANPTSGETGDPFTKVVGSSASLVLLQVNTGLEKRSLKVKEFSSDHRLYQFLPADFKIRINNDGNIFVAPKGNIFISRGGKNVETLSFNEAGGNVLPNTDRVFEVPWANGFPAYKDKIVDGKPIQTPNGNKRQLTWNFSRFSKFRFGKYDATLLLVYSDGQRDIPVKATLSFWVIPWVPLLIILVITLVILIGFLTFGRNALKKVMGRSRAKS
jgi:hypothetical protein